MSPVAEFAGLEYVTINTVVAGELQVSSTSGHRLSTVTGVWRSCRSLVRVII
jgi:hypothetical protein